MIQWLDVSIICTCFWTTDFDLCMPIYYVYTYVCVYCKISQLFQSTGVMKSGRLMFTRKLTAPSIPTPGQSYGYDEAGDGNLTPQPLPAQDSSMGPAYYNVSHVWMNDLSIIRILYIILDIVLVSFLVLKNNARLTFMRKAKQFISCID